MAASTHVTCVNGDCPDPADDTVDWPVLAARVQARPALHCAACGWVLSQSAPPAAATPEPAGETPTDWATPPDLADRLATIPTGRIALADPARLDTHAIRAALQHLPTTCYVTTCCDH